MRTVALAAALLAGYSFLSLPANAQTIYPINRAQILAGSRFDLKVEFPAAIDDVAALKLTINGKDAARVLGGSVELIAREDGKEVSSLLLRDATITQPGTYTVSASDGSHTRSVTWEVYGTPAKAAARNVILFIGDGFSIAHRTAARLLSKGVSDGKINGKLAMDEMPYMALLTTQGTDSIITDSANAAHAYTTGHKSCVNALGVYCSRAANSLAHPKVETIAEIAKRHGLAVGAVTNSEIEDATPAAMAAHTRRRSDFNDIVKMFYDAKIDVLMGGGSPNFLPKTTPGSKRTDDVDYLEQFKNAGYAFATTKSEMNAVADDAKTTKLLGLYNTSNVDGALDLKFLKKGSVARFPDQPDVVEEMRAAIKVLSRNKKGFVLMVESARIDKYSHSMDPERAIYDTIMLDDAVRAAQQWDKQNGGKTLILVTADHTHGVSLVGTVDDDKPGSEMRNKVGVYASAGFPNYPAPDADGYPNKVDVSRRLRMVFGSTPDYYDTFRPFLDGEFVPAIKNGDGVMVANEKYKDVPGAVLRVGNLPNSGPDAANQGVHTGDDVVLTAMGPGAQRVHGQLENSDLFRIMAEALALAPQGKPSVAKSAKPALEAK